MMTRRFLPLIAAIAIGCSEEDQPTDRLDGPMDPMVGSPEGAGGDSQHAGDPNGADPSATFQPPDVGQRLAERAIVGTPELSARLHSCGKITYASLGRLLTSRGVNATNNTANTAGRIYRDGSAALGVANYGARVSESAFSSTSAISKQMDIFAMASSEIAAATWAPTGCAGVKLFEADQFTKDGISCLLGKPARDEHVALANQAMSQSTDPIKGKQLAISALLSAAHVCE